MFENKSIVLIIVLIILIVSIMVYFFESKSVWFTSAALV